MTQRRTGVTFDDELARRLGKVESEVKSLRSTTLVRAASHKHSEEQIVGIRSPSLGPRVDGEGNPIDGTLNLTTGANENRVYLEASWSPVDNAKSYDVELLVPTIEETEGDEEGEYSVEQYTIVITRTQTEDTSVRFDPVEPLTDYLVRVRVYYSSISGPSDYLEGTITSGRDETIPQQVTGLTGGAGWSTITVAWDDVEDADVRDGNGQYEVQVATDEEFTQVVRSTRVGGTVTSFTDLDAGTEYWVQVRAIDSSGNEGPWSAAISLTPASPDSGDASDGEPPSSSPAASVTPGIGFLSVAWSPVENADPVTYHVHVSTTNDFTPNSGTKHGEVDGTIYFLRTTAGGNQLAYDTTYYVKVIATDVDGAASPGDQDSAQLLRATGDDIVAESVTANHLVAWSVSAGRAIIADATINTAKIANLAVTDAKINDLNVDKVNAGSLAAQYIKTSEIAADTAFLNALVVDTAQIKNGAITNAKIQSLAANKLTTDTLTATTITLGSGGILRAGTTTNGVYFDTNGIRMYDGSVLKVDIPKNGNATFKDVTMENVLITGNVLEELRWHTGSFPSQSTGFIGWHEGGFRISSGGTFSPKITIGSARTFIEGSERVVIESWDFINRIYGGLEFCGGWSGEHLNGPKVTRNSAGNLNIADGALIVENYVRHVGEGSNGMMELTSFSAGPRLRARNSSGAFLADLTYQITQSKWVFQEQVQFDGIIGVAWSNLPYQSGWSHGGSDLETLQYKVVGDLVFIKGVVSGGSGNIARLPAEARPTQRSVHLCWTSPGVSAARVDVHPDGFISHVSGNVSFVALSGIVFRL